MPVLYTDVSVFYTRFRRHAMDLFLAFTMRGSLIRVIAARDMNRKERKHYEEIAAAWILFASRRSMTLEGNLRSGIVTVLRFPTERFGPL